MFSRKSGAHNFLKLGSSLLELRPQGVAPRSLRVGSNGCKGSSESEEVDQNPATKVDGLGMMMFRDKSRPKMLHVAAPASILRPSGSARRSCFYGKFQISSFSTRTGRLSTKVQGNRIGVWSGAVFVFFFLKNLLEWSCLEIFHDMSD
jgi:hypothetical protein